MRKLILVFVALAITVGANAQADSKSRTTSPGNVDKNQQQNMQNNPTGNKTHPDGLIMQNGKMMWVKNGQMTLVEGDQTMSNGTKVMRNGTYIQKDGTRMNLKEGQQLDMSGNIIQNMQNNPDGKHPDGLIMQNGKVMQVKNGQMTLLEGDHHMSNGTRVMSNGTCIKKDGTRSMMKEGQQMDMSGNMIPCKTEKDKNMYLVPDSTINRNR